MARSRLRLQRSAAKSFSSFTIRSIVENLNVVIFPCVNPDGRAFDQQYDVLWRKNRNPAASAGDPQRVGVDINRNHSFLWDFRTKFDPQAMNFGTLASDDPGSDIYHGSAPDSEPESRNVHWLLDTYRFTRWYLDIHSYTGDMLFVWGDDTDQSTNPTENFRNSAYDGQRGVEGGYAEYIPSADLNLAAGTAQRVVNAINAVRGGNYEAKQSVFLRSTSTGISSPVSGAVDDYAYSRHCRTARRERCTRSPSSSAIGLVTFGRAFTRPGRRWSKSWQRSTPAWPSSAHQPHPAFVPPWEVAYRHLWPWQIWDPMVRTVEPVVRPLVERALTLARRG